MSALGQKQTFASGSNDFSGSSVLGADRTQYERSMRRTIAVFRIYLFSVTRTRRIDEQRDNPSLAWNPTLYLRMLVCLLSRVLVSSCNDSCEYPAMSTRQDGPMDFSGNCKRCAGRTERVLTLPKSVGDTGYDVYQCLDCNVIEWLSTRSHRDAPAFDR